MTDFTKETLRDKTQKGDKKNKSPSQKSSIINLETQTKPLLKPQKRNETTTTTAVRMWWSDEVVRYPKDAIGYYD